MFSDSSPSSSSSSTRSTTTSSTDDAPPNRTRISTGVPGLDAILDGGLLPGRAYLVRGGPGTGKTQIGLKYLQEGASQNGDGSHALYITLGERPEQIRADARGLGVEVKGIEFLDLSPSSEFFAEDESYDIFLPAEVERGPVTEAITDRIEAVEPTRVFVDSMTQLQFLSTSPEVFRKQALALIRYLTEQGATVCFATESGPDAPDTALQFLSDGILQLTQEDGHRRVEITKYRGSSYRSGRHTLAIERSGARVYPRLEPSARSREYQGESISSGVPELDELLGGGLARSTVSLISGSSGVGKTTLGLQFMKEAAGRGERSVVYSFEEQTFTLIRRCESVNIPVRSMIDRGTLRLESIRPGVLSTDQFVDHVRTEVEEHGSRIVMIDSLLGFRNALHGGHLEQTLHMLGDYLVSRDVSLLITDEIETVTGDFKPTSSSVSYIADNLLFLRYLEMSGELRKAIGVLKKRTSDFEKSLREFAITKYGIRVGSPLTGLRGVLVGQPEWIDEGVTPDRRFE